MIHFKLTSRLLNNMVFLLTVILGFAIFGSGFGEDGDNATVADNAAQANETVGARAIPRRLVDCKVNEVYNRCGTACQPTCFELTPECTKECVEGCFCKEGYLRNQEKVCVHPSECQGTVFFITRFDMYCTQSLLFQNMHVKLTV